MSVRKGEGIAQASFIAQTVPNAPVAYPIGIDAKRHNKRNCCIADASKKSKDGQILDSKKNSQLLEPK